MPPLGVQRVAVPLVGAQAVAAEAAVNQAPPGKEAAVQVEHRSGTAAWIDFPMLQS
jgi:hypothetical protein